MAATASGSVGSDSGRLAWVGVGSVRARPSCSDTVIVRSALLGSSWTLAIVRPGQHLGPELADLDPLRDQSRPGPDQDEEQQGAGQDQGEAEQAQHQLTGDQPAG